LAVGSLELEPGLLPLTIGVVGHRAIAESDVARIRLQIREIITTYQLQSPSTPIILLSALAEGADQLAAEVALDISGVFVVAVLPMPSEEYARDFHTEEKLRKYRTLLKSVYRVVEAQDFYGQIEVNFGVPALEEHSWKTAHGRDIAYRDCGRFISQQSHMLIALWDGNASTLTAGTVDTISHRLNSSKKIPFQNDRIRLWPQESGVLFHVLAHREDFDISPQNAGTIAGEIEIRVLETDFESHPWNPNEIDKTAEMFQWLNSLPFEPKKRVVRGSLLSKSIMESVDFQARKLQSRLRLLVASLLTLGVASLFLMDLQHDLKPLWLYFISIGVLIFTALLWLQFVRGSLKDRFYQLRTLAEGMRVQCAWLDCGIVENPSDDYLRAIPDVSWIPRAMRSSWFVDQLHRINSATIQEPLNVSPEEAAMTWIRGQIDYFGGTTGVKGAILSSREKYKRYEKLSLAGLFIAIICMIWDGLRFLTGGNPFPHWTIETSQVLMHLSLSISAASAAYSQLMAFREIERQYEISHQIFRQGIEILKHETSENSSNREHLLAIVIQVGREALQETGTWLALKRDRAVHPI
jgi:hypothetical protein